jgi:hypothetical protein
MDSEIKEIEKGYEEVQDLIEKEIEKLSENALQFVLNRARIILQNDPNLHEFVMAMGSCFFTAKDDGKYDPNAYTDEEWEEWCYSDDFVNNYKGIIDDENFHSDFFELVDGFDDKFNIKGYPVRFTANSKEVHDWGDTIKNPVVYEERN